MITEYQKKSLERNLKKTITALHGLNDSNLTQNEKDRLNKNYKTTLAMAKERGLNTAKYETEARRLIGADI